MMHENDEIKGTTKAPLTNQMNDLLVHSRKVMLTNRIRKDAFQNVHGVWEW